MLVQVRPTLQMLVQYQLTASNEADWTACCHGSSSRSNKQAQKRLLKPFKTHNNLTITCTFEPVPWYLPTVQVPRQALP